jgi:hypothetical protein
MGTEITALQPGITLLDPVKKYPRIVKIKITHGKPRLRQRYKGE